MNQITYVAAHPGELFPVTPQTQCIFNGLLNHPSLVYVDGLLATKEAVESPVARAKCLAPLLPPHSAFSHQTARWIHSGEGSPFPLCIVSRKRNRKDEPFIRIYRRHALADLSPNLPVPVVSSEQTMLDLQAD